MIRYLYFICICSCLIACEDEINPGPIEELFFESTDSSFLYSDYDFVIDSDLQTILFDGFDNNENNWSQGGNENYSIYISDGKLKMESKRNLLYYVYLDFIDFFSTNFQIEINFEFPDFSSNQFFAFRWGGLNGWDNNYGFRIHADGYFQIKHKSDDEWQDNIFGKTMTDAIIKNVKNKLTIRKISGSHYFFINEKFVAKTNNIVLKGNEFGPSIGSYSQCEFDNLKVDFIN